MVQDSAMQHLHFCLVTMHLTYVECVVDAFRSSVPILPERHKAIGENNDKKESRKMTCLIQSKMQSMKKNKGEASSWIVHLIQSLRGGLSHWKSSVVP